MKGLWLLANIFDNARIGDRILKLKHTAKSFNTILNRIKKDIYQQLLYMSHLLYIRSRKSFDSWSTFILFFTPLTQPQTGSVFKYRGKLVKKKERGLHCFN
jgi:hypothetical protein